MQYPSHDLAVKTGLCFVAGMIFLFGAALILFGNQRSMQETSSVEMGVGPLPENAQTGQVYLLDEQSGNILQVGTYVVEDGESKLNLRVQEEYLDENVRWTAQYWHPAYDTYGPYAQFIHDERLQNRISEIVSRAFEDPSLRERSMKVVRFIFENLFAKAKPRLREIKNDAQLRSLIIDMGIEEATKMLSDEDDDVGERTWVAPMMELIFFHLENWPWERWINEIVADAEKEKHFSGLLREAEPYFREALQAFLWNRESVIGPGPEYAPNVRLLWVARRTLFGAREPAITLTRSSDGTVLNEDNVLKLKNIR